jgi:hypothetical protein
LFGFHKKGSELFLSLPLLEAIKLKSSSQIELDALPKLERLTRLELGLLPKLENLEALSKCGALQWLRISKCGRAVDYHVLSELRKLRGLLIDTDKKIESVEFVESLLDLRIFNFSLNIRDGKVRRLLKCPALARARFADRRHYDIRRDELNEILNGRKFPITNSEELTFQFVSSGINDWQVLTASERTLPSQLGD